MKKYTLKELKTAKSPFVRAQIDYAADLNKSQRDVVKSASGPSLVLAGAGSGKTRVLIYRIAYLLEKGANPSEIMLATFTNKAAKEMNERITGLLGQAPRGLWSGTFHHIGNRFLRMYGKRIGIEPNFQIMDQDDSRQMIRHVLRQLDYHHKELNLPKVPVIQSIISFSENAGHSIDETMDLRYEYLIEYCGYIKEIKAAYIKEKKATNSLDYDDLLTKWLKLLEEEGRTAGMLAKKFRYVMIDEYQDTNFIQNEIIQILSKAHNNILVVGDDAQSIYSFRGALVENILDFPKKYQDVKTYKLETNYRSIPEILDLANQSIVHNEKQFHKTLHAVKPAGSLPAQINLRNPKEQSQFIIQRIGELQDAGMSLSDIAVLHRAHYQAADLEMNLIRKSIPYVIRGGIKFFEQAHVKDVLAFMRIVCNPDDRLSWIRSMSLMDGIGQIGADKIFHKLKEQKYDIQSIKKNITKRSLPGFLKFEKIYKALQRNSLQNNPGRMIELVLENGYEDHVLLSFENAGSRLEDLDEFVRFARDYRDLNVFLNEVSLGEAYKGNQLAAEEKQKDSVVLSTIHQAKGLEWKVVFIIGLTEGQFPHPQSFSDLDQLEEERRLFYVAITRAKDELYLLSPLEVFDRASGVTCAAPSLFIHEIDDAFYESWQVDGEEDVEFIDVNSV